MVTCKAVSKVDVPDKCNLSDKACFTPTVSNSELRAVSGSDCVNHIPMVRQRLFDLSMILILLTNGHYMCFANWCQTNG